ncbi:hypothetical protein PPYR_13235 [Photinus pyralis]|uniref:DUF4485 domain-containing protein n=1 Tax=Photinus pyralis TaxID=7054 RepID=A0A5N4A8H3_PHOPY|nr:uncharacterized protein LOC116179021 [Photinus pyralis]KAB0793615.1 hypothetical protein PPYR_13235 [Photinus pyralis]
MDIYDEEFTRLTMLAKQMISKIERKKDREILSKWIRKLIGLKSYDPVVKKNRNHFFKYMLTVLHKGLKVDPVAHYGYPQYDERYQQVDGQNWSQEQGFMKRWSNDKKTYVAAKPLPGKGALVYMAVAKDPTLGWEIPNRK